MKTWSRSLILAAGLILAVAGCGGTNSPGTTAKGTITVAGFNFAESSILANMYGKALAAKGYTVNYKLNLGAREVVEPALEKGDIDLYPGYAATDLEYINGKKGEASGDAQANVTKLNSYLSSKGIKALNPSNANDQNAFAVKKATADKYNLKKVSDLAPVSSNMILGGPPECATRIFCAAGLEKVYGVKFKSIKELDAGGPLTKAALDRGDIDVGLVFSSDGGVAAKGFVVLDDDKHLQGADNIVPLVRTKVLNDEVTKLLNDIDAALTQADLLTMNKSADVDKQDPDVLATNWLKQHGYIK